MRFLKRRRKANAFRRVDNNDIVRRRVLREELEPVANVDDEARIVEKGRHYGRNGRDTQMTVSLMSHRTTRFTVECLETSHTTQASPPLMTSTFYGLGWLARGVWAIISWYENSLRPVHRMVPSCHTSHNRRRVHLDLMTSSHRGSCGPWAGLAVARISRGTSHLKCCVHHNTNSKPGSTHTSNCRVKDVLGLSRERPGRMERAFAVLLSGCRGDSFVPTTRACQVIASFRLMGFHYPPLTSSLGGLGCHPGLLMLILATSSIQPDKSEEPNSLR